MRRFLGMALIMSLVFMLYSKNVMACPYTSGCYSNSTYKTHGQQNGWVEHHMVGEPNGYVSECAITHVSGHHYNYCSGCNYYICDTIEECSEIHNNVHCYSRYHLCGI